MKYNYWAFGGGMLLFLSAQIFRAMRWQILLPTETGINKRSLTLYVSIGSLTNMILPLHLGDLLRCLMVSRSAKHVNFPFAINSIFIERSIDVLMLTTLVIVFRTAFQVYLQWDLVFLVLPLVLLALWALVGKSPKFRKFLFSFSCLWNTKIQTAVLDFFWSLMVQIRHRRFLCRSFNILSAVMWLTYLASYCCFGLAMNIDNANEAWVLFHGNAWLGTITDALFFKLNSDYIYSLLLFLSVPIGISAIYGYSKGLVENLGKRTQLIDYISSKTSMRRYGIPSAYIGDIAYQSFLFSHFSDTESVIGHFGTTGFEDCRIAKMFKGGSGAITAVVEKDGNLSIRKVVHVSAEQRLHDQYLWLVNTDRTKLPLVHAHGWVSKGDYCYYEMPFNSSSVDMYEWLHTVPLESALLRFSEIINSLQAFHVSQIVGTPNSDALADYIEAKAVDNCNIIYELVSQFIDLSRFTVNGVSFSFNDWDFLKNKDMLLRNFSSQYQVNIHGDCTIDNIIALADDSWIFIDPNPSSQYKSRLMDWAKLMQSVHLGYEQMIRGVRCDFSDNSIKYFYHRSELYHRLYLDLKSHLLALGGNDLVKEVMLHELIHYLRLIPYKFSQGKNTGIMFFGATCFLIQEFKKDFVLV